MAELHNVNSTLVKSIVYKEDKQTLYVEYQSGARLAYDHITADEAKAFMNADSKGKWAHEHLFNKPYRRTR